MDRRQRAKLKQEIRKAYKIYSIIDELPKRYRDMILDCIISGRGWNEIQEKCHYSERQGRNILNEGLEETAKRLSSLEKSTKKSTRIPN